MRYWIGVVSRDHVERGVAGSFCQLCHGKASAMKKLSPGDWIAFYSPKTAMTGGEPLQAFTAIGQVKAGDPYTFDMGGGFVPTRRNVEFLPCREAPIRPLVERLSFIRNKQSWGYVFRFGQIEVPAPDFRIIAEAMNVPSAVPAEVA
ncbi:MAG TPA: EVE domain-containing protein [Xanthobacteraceae bacterium]|nr:EVE domain-containing protein [Xanthobacteraceae bacterium]